MMNRPAILAAFAAMALGACTPTSKVAEPDIVMKSPVSPHVLAPCLATKLGDNFRDHRPTVDLYAGIYEIAIDSPRGEKLAYVEVESDYAGGSFVRFWNGDLYWPNHITSGVWPDVMRDNWHRFENAENACQPKSMTAAKPVAPKTMPAPAAVPVQKVQAKPLKPLVAVPLKPLAEAPSAAPATTSATPPAKAPVATSSATPAATPGAPLKLTP